MLESNILLVRSAKWPFLAMRKIINYALVMPERGILSSITNVSLNKKKNTTMLLDDLVIRKTNMAS